jgi:dephospho-CoA kinase
MKIETNWKILILGNATHGKDTLAELFNKYYGFTYSSSSQAAADIFIYDELKEKYGYKTPEECFKDRVNHRAEWYTLICDYNKDNRARLGKAIVDKTGCYVGMRDKREIEECIKQGIFDFIIWVDASKRLPEEPRSSFNIDIDVADIIIDNNGTLEEFERRAINLGKILFNPKMK